MTAIGTSVAVLPVPRPQSWAPAWPAQHPGERRRCVLDVGEHCRQAGTSIASAFVLADPMLLSGGVGWDGTTAWAYLTGGTPGQTAVVGFVLLLDNGERVDASVRLPITPLRPEVPDGALAAGGQVLTAGYGPVELASVGPLPGGPLGSDLVMLVRPGVAPGDARAGTVPFAALGGGGGGGSITFTQGLPASVWTVAHNLGRRPAVSVLTTAGDLVDGDVRHLNPNNLTITFAAAFAGVAELT